MRDEVYDDVVGCVVCGPHFMLFASFFCPVQRKHFIGAIRVLFFSLSFSSTTCNARAFVRHDGKLWDNSILGRLV